ncbi:RRP12-like protein [Neodiprion fabricii]|uniref:RRP12-like protein n=1 Tax=Neodiprion fabricii TaxID=2872261 RepID=UPI001ED8D115|nr:RRP12-like protein [Neodiprion fabricii]
MGKIKPRLGSRKKAKRWPKGQSSSSNPETKQHRDQARTRFFQENFGPGGLTSDALHKHDAIQGTHQNVQNIEIDDDDETQATTIKTFNTFASDWSSCSNISFSRFLSGFQASSAMHKEMLAVLAAVTEVIKQNGGTESSTEYYAALMTTLEATETEESVAAVLSLLGMGLKTVPISVLRLQFSQASQTFLQVLEKYATSENFLIQRTCIGCLSILLRSQEAAVWSSSSTVRILDAILVFTVHSKPKLRKAAQHAVCSILKGSHIMKNDNPPAYHPAASQVAKHCLVQLEMASQPGGITATLHVLTMLKEILHQLPKSHVKVICEELLKIMTMNNLLFTSCCLQAFHSLFISKPLETTLPPTLNAQIINALYDYQPAPGDTQPTLAWLAVMQEAHCNLVQNSLQLCAANLPRILEKCTELWLSDRSEVLSGASHTIKTLLQDCVAPLCKYEDGEKKYKTAISKSIHIIQQGMKYQYHSAWHHVLHLLAIIFQIAGKTCQDQLLEILVALAELRDSYKFSYNSEVEYAVGAAVQSMGPEIVLNTIPLQTSTDTIDLNRSWLLPTLKENIVQAPLSYFVKSLLPLATMCEQKSVTLKSVNDGIGSHSYQLLTSQIWALLPNFCNNPGDTKDSFKSIARILGIAISERKDLRLSVMASIRKLITRATDDGNRGDIEELAKFAKNFLPLLFNLYTSKPNGSDEEGQRLAALETIKIYLTISSKELAAELFDRALERMQSSDTDRFVKESILDLIRVLACHTDGARLLAVYKEFVPVLTDTKNPKEQKKAYRFLEEICSSEKEACKEFIQQNRHGIQKMLLKSLSSTVASSKGARLRCLEHLVKSQPQLDQTKLLRSIVPEAVLCLKEVNERCRASAYQLLNTIAEQLLQTTKNLEKYIEMLVAGLAGTPTLCSATLLALASVTYNYNGALGLETVKEIVKHACVLLTSPTREIALSAISYIKVYLTIMPSPTVAPMLPTIVTALCDMTDDCQRHFRQKFRDVLVKLIRKYGADLIMGLVKPTATVMLKRIKNLKKIQARKQKMKDQKKSETGSKDGVDDEEFNVKARPKTVEEILADSDDDFVDTETDEGVRGRKQKLKKKAWIHESEENIVDFVDAGAAKNITATQPGALDSTQSIRKKKEGGFKTDEKGRLIIKDDDSDGEMEIKPKKLPFLGSDSENNSDDEDTKSTVSTAKTGRKRRLSGSLDGISMRSDRPASKYQAGGSGIHRHITKNTPKNNPGSEYSAQKARGDIKKKGKPDPYAYVPLTRSALNKRKKMKNAGRFKNIISGAKKGANVGRKNRDRPRKGVGRK